MDEIKEPFCVTCPHCLSLVLIEKLNCKIFRHGVFIENGKQIDPHLPKNVCENLFNNKKIYGCGKPFKIILEDKKYIAVICDYI
jgi:hypothetical protein